jgi:hypothetical protein
MFLLLMSVSPAGSVGFTRRAGATRYTHGSITEMLQKYPASITALDPAAQQAAGQDQQQAQPQQAAHGTGMMTRSCDCRQHQCSTTHTACALLLA